MNHEETARKKAEEIVDASRHGACGACGSIINEGLLVANITTALTEARSVPKGHHVVRIEPLGNDMSGKPVPLPLLADGTLWCLNEILYTHDTNGYVCDWLPQRAPVWTSSGWAVEWGEGEVPLSECYPNRESAESARKEKP